MKDKLGNEITVGCYLAYGHALGRCAGLRIGKVLALVEEQEKHYGGELKWHSKRVGDRWVDDLTKPVMKFRITVMGIDDDWSFEEPKLQSRKGTLQFPNRTIVLKDDQVSEKYKQFLKDVQ